MKRISFIILYILFISSGCKAQSSLTQVKTTECHLQGFTSPGIFEAAQIYEGIEGQLVMTLYPDSIEGAGHIVSIIASKSNWLKLHFEGLTPPENSLWIKGGKIGTTTRNYDNEVIPLYQEPDKKSKVVSELHGQQIVLIYGGSGHWAYVKGKGKDGKEVEGWLEPEMQCPNPYTTCPTSVYKN